jgi:hypothetical protein
VGGVTDVIFAGCVVLSVGSVSLSLHLEQVLVCLPFCVQVAGVISFHSENECLQLSWSTVPEILPLGFVQEANVNIIINVRIDKIIPLIRVISFFCIMPPKNQ